METNANEREFDTTNETNEDETYEQDTQNIPEENDETSTDGGDSSDGDTQGDDDSVTISKSEWEKTQREAAAAKRLREKRSQEPKEKPEKESNSQYDQELIERTYLAAQMGIQDADIQDEAIRLARKFGMSIHEASKDDDIASRLQGLQKRKEQQRSIAKDQKGSPAQNKGVDYWVKKFKADGSLPDDSKMIAQIMDKLG